MRRPLLTKLFYIFISSTVINSYKYRNVNCHLTQSRAICKCTDTQAVWHCIGHECVSCRKEVTISEAVALENYSFVIRDIS
uniref:Secreted protein n=1 Tax=Rhipicephalus appendiculatus TaxID=34631 RepID=A0A131YEK2_RHIAP